MSLAELGQNSNKSVFICASSALNSFVEMLCLFSHY